jgi:hypothetical protein
MIQEPLPLELATTDQIFDELNSRPIEFSCWLRYVRQPKFSLHMSEELNATILYPQAKWLLRTMKRFLDIQEGEQDI